MCKAHHPQSLHSSLELQHDSVADCEVNFPFLISSLSTHYRSFKLKMAFVSLCPSETAWDRNPTLHCQLELHTSEKQISSALSH